MKVRSLRFEKDYDLQLYAVEENALVIRHRSLEKIYWELPDKERPKAEYEVLDLAKLPGIPALFAIKCIMTSGDFRIETIGEFTCIDWDMSNLIKRSFPLSMCQNRAFDRAFIRYMQFEIPNGSDVFGLYSSEEIAINGQQEWNPDTAPGFNQEEDNVTKPNSEEFEPGPEPMGVPREDWGVEDVISPDSPLEPSEPDNGGFPGFNGDIPAPPDIPGLGMPDAPQGWNNGPDHFQPDIPHAPQNAMGEMNGIPNAPAMDVLPPLPPMEDDLPFTVPGSGPAVPSAPSAAQNGYQQALAGSPVDVYRVSFDIGTGRTRVETNLGILYFDSYKKKWENTGIDLKGASLDEVYRKASDLIRQPLADYTGMTLQ